MSQDEIGRMAGLPRQNTNRALHDLEQTGLVRIRYGAIEVLDLEGLHAYSARSSPACPRLTSPLVLQQRRC
nr:helix-turn-helix domain-containing protein [Paraburkholderia fynbosensis]